MNVLKSMGENRFMPDTDTAFKMGRGPSSPHRCGPIEKKGTAVPLERMEITDGMTSEEIEALEIQADSGIVQQGLCYLPPKAIRQEICSCSPMDW